MKFIEKILEKADLFGIPIEFNLNKKSKFSSKYSKIVTILYFLLSLLIISILLVKFLDTKNPKIT